MYYLNQVCCPISHFNEKVTRDPEPNYRNHVNFKLIPALKECGQVGSSDRILNGNKSLPGEHPFVARIGVMSKFLIVVS